ncbi:MAG: hypothetical protein FJW27_03900 [Acidimicrobiia bacterium]|nr:hypothetical protein [Acidimicrobiia bacterium]
MTIGGLFAAITVCACLAAAAVTAAQAKQTIVGTITDDMCARADHSKMRMGSNDAECAKACVDAHGAAYVVFDGKTAYGLSDQKTAATLVAKKVRVVGTVDDKTKKIAVDSIRAE